MRWLALLLCGCSATAHIDLAFDVQLGSQCQAAAPGNPPVPMSCDQLTLDCADHLLFRVRRDQNQQPGDIISSRCLDLAAAGHPRDLCALGQLQDPVSLIDSVPSGTRFIFQLAALRLQDPNGGCDNELAPPLRVFSGLSDSVLVDGSSHTLTVHLTSCGSCSDLPPMGGEDAAASFDLGAPSSDLNIGPAVDLGAPPSDGAAASPDLGVGPKDAGPADLSRLPDLMTPLCPPGYDVSPYFSQGGALCCPSPSVNCPAPGSRCDDGSLALLAPGGCCAVCD